MAKSFVERMKPLCDRTREIEVPFSAGEGQERLKVTIRVLGGAEIGMAETQTDHHFAKLRALQPKKEQAAWKPAIEAHNHRTRAEVVYLAVVDEHGKKLGAGVDDVEALPAVIVNTLYEEWNRLQDELTVAPLDKVEMRALIEELKKNTDSVPLRALPSIWLRGLILTLVDLLPPSTEASSHG